MKIIRFAIIILALTGWCAVASAALVTTHKSSQGWELLVDGKPFLIHGMCYYPTSIGESAHDQTRRNWEMVDDDHDGRNDFAYQSWVDANRNNKRDPEEKEIGDFQLMKNMGVNAIRIYHHVSADPDLVSLNKKGDKSVNFPAADEKKILRELYGKFGIMTAMGDLIGAYTISTGTTWEAGTDYTDPVQKANMLKSVEDMVREHKDEPYVLMWVLGNENNLPYPHTNARQHPEAYAKFVNEAAVLIKKIDQHRHPVAVCNGGSLEMLDQYAQYAPEVDIFGLNDYELDGFHDLWKKVSVMMDRPVLFTEFGTGYPIVINGKLREDSQVRVHKNSWVDIYKHSHGHKPPGNAIGGFVFEWTDNWWEDGDKWHQNINPDGSGWNHEYNGMTSYGDGSAGSLSRQIKKVYGMYQQLWKKE